MTSEQIRAREEFLAQNEEAKFVAFVRIGNDSEEFFTSRDEYISRLDKVWTLPISLDYGVLKVEKEQ